MLTMLLATVAVFSSPTLQVRVDGEGYLRFVRDGRVAYAKTASLKVSDDRIVNGGGAMLLPSVTVPKDASALDVDLEGAIYAVQPQGKSPIGRIVLALFPDSTELSPEDGLLISSVRPTLGNPGEGTNGVMRVVGVPQGAAIKVTSNAPPIKGHPIRTVEASSPPARPGVVQIDVLPAPEVESDEIALGDIATITADKATAAKLAAVSIGTTPLVGVRIPLDAFRITSRIRVAQIDPSKFVVNVPQGAYLTRKCSHLPQQQFVDCAIAFAKTQADAGIDFGCRDQNPDFLAPVGQVDLKVEQYAPSLSGACVTVAVYVDGKRRNARLVRLEMTGYNNNPLIRVPSRTRVKIVVRCNGAVVETTGRTIRSGIVGQTVDVETEDRSTHTGTLTGPTTVEVKL